MTHTVEIIRNIFSRCRSLPATAIASATPRLLLNAMDPIQDATDALAEPCEPPILLSIPPEIMDPPPDATDALAEPCEPPTLLSLPPEILDRMLQSLLPRDLFAASASWTAAVALASSCTAMHDSLGNALLASVPSVAALEPRAERAHTCWFSLLAALRAPDGGRWHSVRPLRAKRPASKGAEPMQEAPQLSGGTLCALGGSRCVLYGGRSSESGLTLGSARLITISWYPLPIAQWDDLRPPAASKRPAARCYHTAVRWAAAERSAPRGSAKMLVFGGEP